MSERAFYAYYRVSTERQGASGLGLEAQRSAVLQHMAREGGRIEGEYVEIESGKRSDRPKLAEAIRECKRSKATLIIAKLDRLARNVHFISGLLESGVDFVAVDNPHANRFQIHLLAAVAEYERDMISKRTKEALAQAKARGVKLGAKDQRALSRAGAQALKASALDFAEKLRPIVEGLIAQGINGPSALSEALNARGVVSRTGGRWYPSTVSKVLARL
jgi:DNA invertase Pin-like site-specific DNA recombinase